MIGIEPTSLATAGKYMAEYLGLSWDTDRSEIVKRINEFRDLLYTDPTLKLFDNVFECLCVRNFPLECGTSCSDKTFQGIALPEHIISIAGAWESHEALGLTNRWRSTHAGVSLRELGERVSLIETSFQLPVERLMTKADKLQVFCTNIADAGKIVYAEVLTSSGRQRIAFPLRFDSWSCSQTVASRIESITLPEGRIGSVILAQTTGGLEGPRVLGIYSPAELVPSYRVFKVATKCRAGKIWIQGNRRFRLVEFDHDVVEIGSLTVLRYAAEYLRYGIGSVENADLAKSQNAYKTMVGAIKGLMARAHGGAKQDPNIFAGRTASPTNILPGYTK